MGIAWQEHVLVLLALFDKDVKQTLDCTNDTAQTVTGKKLEVYKNLIIA